MLSDLFPAVAYALAFSWGLVILLSLIGWGIAVNRVLFPRDDFDWGLQGAWGVSLCVALGGLLNLAKLTSRASILLIVAFGVVVFLVGRLGARRLGQLAVVAMDLYRKDRLLAIGAILALLVLGLQYSASVRGQVVSGSLSVTDFNPHDDFHAYLVFPEKMIQTGSLGPDPYSERRITSGLGGQYFLDTLVLAALSDENVHLIDPGLGMILAVGLLLGYARWRRATAAGALGATLLLLVVPPTTSNITSLVVDVALFFAQYRTLAWTLTARRGLIGSSVVVALLTAGLGATKATLIPVASLLFVGLYAIHLIPGANRKLVALQCGLSGALTVGLLAPWMVAMKESSGTFLFPVLGLGDHGSAYGAVQLPSHYLREYALSQLLPAHDAKVLLAVLGILVVVGAYLAAERSLDGVVLCASVLGGIVAVSLATGLFDVYRFSYPFIIVPVLVGVLEATRKGGALRLPTESGVLRLGGSVLLLGVAILGGGLAMYWGEIHSLRHELADAPLWPQDQREEYVAMQAAVPQNAVILTRLDKPFLLNFRSNTIYIDDWPFGAGPAPGISASATPEELASYLQSEGVRYVAYSYRDEAGFPKSTFSYRLGPQMPPLTRRFARDTFAFQDDLAALGKTRKHVYDDGQIFVLDITWITVRQEN